MRVEGVLLLACFAVSSVLCQKRAIALLRGQEVVIENPGSPGQSPAHLNLEWILTSPPGTQIDLHCKTLSLYRFDEVCTGYAFHIEGVQEGSKVMCGNLWPFTETSVGNTMKLRLNIGEYAMGRVQCTASVNEGEMTTTLPHEQPDTPNSAKQQIHLKLDDNAYLARKSDELPRQKIELVFTTEQNLRIGVNCDDVRYPGGKDCAKYNIGIKVSDGTTQETVCEPYTLISLPGATVKIDFDNKERSGSFRCTIVAVKSGTSADYFRELVTLEEDSSEFGVVPGQKTTSCPCGWSNKEDGGRIIGGTRTKTNEYSFMVGFIDGGRQSCGGSILTEYHVLTAAHCTRMKEAKDIQVVVGAQNLDQDNEQYRQMHEVAEIIDHPEYVHEDSLKNDVSILRLKTPIQFNKKIGPVCLPPPSMPSLNNKNVRAIGWGVTEQGFTSELLKAVLRVVDPVTCLVTNGRNLDPANPNKLCVYSHNRDICMGDSGGPIVWLDPETNRFTQVASSSYVMGCNSSVPSVGAATQHFVPWIQNVIGGRGCTKLD